MVGISKNRMDIFLNLMGILKNIRVFLKKYVGNFRNMVGISKNRIEIILNVMGIFKDIREIFKNMRKIFKI